MRSDACPSSACAPPSDFPRTIFLLLGAFAALLFAVSTNAAVSWIAVDASSGEVLEAERADVPHYPASLTKMMTLYMVFSALHDRRVSLDQLFAVSPHAASRQRSRMGLRPGRRVRLSDLVLGVVTHSANDAAAVIAEGLAGSESRFAQEMTRKAHELGMGQTVFRNASGLPDPEQVTTARDIALLGRALLRDFPREYGYFSTRTFVFGKRTYVNHNHLLEEYPGADGIKTGFTHASGYHLAASAMREGRRLIAVLLGEETRGERDRRMAALLDKAFQTEKMREPPNAEAVAFLQERALDAAAALSPVASAMAASDPNPKVADEEEGRRGAGAWSVQVGAYASRDTAVRVGEQVVGLDERLTSGNQRIVAATGRRGAKNFLVQFGDFTEADARSVCRALREARQDCVVRPPAP